MQGGGIEGNAADDALMGNQGILSNLTPGRNFYNIEKTQGIEGP